MLPNGASYVTTGMLDMLDNEAQLACVLGHEMTHLKNRDMIVITFLSVIPLVCYWAAWNLMFRRSRRSGTAPRRARTRRSSPPCDRGMRRAPRKRTRPITGHRATAGG